MITIDLLSSVPRAHRRYWARQVQPLLLTLGIIALVVTVCLEGAVRTRWRTISRLTIEWERLRAHTAQLSQLERQAARLAERLQQMEQALWTQPRWATAVAAVYRALPDDVTVQEIAGDETGWLVVRGVGVGHRRHPSQAAAEFLDRLQADPVVIAAGRVVEMDVGRVQQISGQVLADFVLRWEPPLRS
jgi:Tfp pilus assembly protein PilN